MVLELEGIEQAYDVAQVALVGLVQQQQPRVLLAAEQRVRRVEELERHAAAQVEVVGAHDARQAPAARVAPNDVAPAQHAADTNLASRIVCIKFGLAESSSSSSGGSVGVVTGEQALVQQPQPDRHSVRHVGTAPRHGHRPRRIVHMPAECHLSAAVVTTRMATASERGCARDGD